MPDRQPALTGAGLYLDLITEAGHWAPEDALLPLAEQALAAAAAETQTPPGGLTLLFTDDAHIQLLNARFRGKDKPTNVLSFPASAGTAPPDAPAYLGDIALAYETVAREAETDGKTFDHHLTHLIVHGFLHLLGYDHMVEDEAEEMEYLERRILERLAIADPYT